MLLATKLTAWVLGTSTEPLWTTVTALFGPVMFHWTTSICCPAGSVSSAPTVPVSSIAAAMPRAPLGLLSRGPLAPSGPSAEHAASPIARATAMARRRRIFTIDGLPRRGLTSDVSPAKRRTSPKSAVLSPSAGTGLTEPDANTYAAPESFDAPNAPTTAVVPVVATEYPKYWPPPAAKTSCWDHVPPASVNTYAAPGPNAPLFSYAPTTAVLPLRATE